MRFVEFKTVAKQDIQMLPRIQSRRIEERTNIVNQTRGLLSEYGIIIPTSISHLRKYISGILEDAENELTTLGRQSISTLYDELIAVTKHYYSQLNQWPNHESGTANFADSVRKVSVAGIRQPSTQRWI